MVECPRTAGGVEGFDPLPPDDALRGAVSARDRKRAAARRDDAPKCHVCAKSTARQCATCIRPSCRHHSRNLSHEHGRAEWRCSTCAP